MSAVKNPRKLAAKAVQNWYDSLIESAEAHTHGGIFQVTLDKAFDDVERALRVEYEKDHGTIKEDQDGVDPYLAREAGYLIGVQVGLRLRGGCDDAAPSHGDPGAAVNPDARAVPRRADAARARRDVRGVRSHDSSRPRGAPGGRCPGYRGGRETLARDGLATGGCVMAATPRRKPTGRYKLTTHERMFLALYRTVPPLAQQTVARLLYALFRNPLAHERSEFDRRFNRECRAGGLLKNVKVSVLGDVLGRSTK